LNEFKTEVTARNQGKLFENSSKSFESFGESGGWSSLKIPGDSSSPKYINILILVLLK
jgi:hypothetical protein